MLGAEGESWPEEGELRLGSRWASGGERVALHIPFFLYIHLISIVVTVCFVCCSVKLPSS